MRKVAGHIMDIFFPQECLFCREYIDIKCDLCDLCHLCKDKIKFLTGNYCISCGTLLPDNVSLCGKCIINPPSYTNLRSVFAYDVNSKNVILNLKFNDDMSYIKIYTRWMYERHKDLFQGIDYIISVPLHRVRILFRKYNQAVLLSRHLSKLSNIPMELFVCKRIKNTVPQFKLSTVERKKNLRGSFRVLNSPAIKDKKILLVDDVVTTGATLKACSDVLIDGGAKEIRALTLARTL